MILVTLVPVWITVTKDSFITRGYGYQNAISLLMNFEIYINIIKSYNWRVVHMCLVVTLGVKLLGILLDSFDTFNHWVTDTFAVVAILFFLFFFWKHKTPSYRNWTTENVRNIITCTFIYKIKNKLYICERYQSKYFISPSSPLNIFI